MPPEPNPEDQGADTNPEDEEEGQGEDEQSPDEQGGGEGEEETPQLLKVGDKEYTPEQIEQLEKKGADYDALLPDYTRKSQKLADYEKGQEEGRQPSPKKEEPFYEKEGWQPKDYGELQKALIHARESGKKEAIRALEEMEEKRVRAKQEIDNFVAEVKSKDKEFDQQDFFDYAARHDFEIKGKKGLESVYSSYKEAREGASKTKEAGDKKKDTVSGPKGGGKTEFSMPMSDIRKSGSAYEAAMDALQKNKK